MKITELPYSCDGWFPDCDYISEDNHVVINDRKEIFRNGNQLKLPKECTAEFPKTRILTKDHFLLIDSAKPDHSDDEAANAWVVNTNGKVEKSIFLGGVHRMFITPSLILASYTDSQLSYDVKYGKHGIVAFDLNFNSLFEYFRDIDMKDRVSMIENYGFFVDSDSKIYFLPYPKFSIEELDMENLSSREVVLLPSYEELGMPEFWNPNSFLKKDDDWYFITKDYQDASAFFSRIFKMTPQKKIEEIGQCCFSYNPQGYAGGRFVVPNHHAIGNYKRCQIIEL